MVILRTYDKVKPLVEKISFEHEFYSLFDVGHPRPGSIWVVLCNLQDYHIMISIFCPNAHSVFFGRYLSGLG
jgi:hypothetical protein